MWGYREREGAQGIMAHVFTGQMLQQKEYAKKRYRGFFATILLANRAWAQLGLSP